MHQNSLYISKIIVDNIYIFFRNLATLFPLTEQLVNVIKDNREVWKVVKSLFQKYSQKGTTGMDILLDPRLDEEIDKTFNSLAGNSEGSPEQETSEQNTSCDCRSSEMNSNEVMPESN